MPVEWRLHVLETELTRAGFKAVIETADLSELGSDEVTTVLDAMVASQQGFPVVLVNGAAACVGDIDAECVVEAARVAR